MNFRRHPIRLLLLLVGVFLPICGYEFVSYDDGL